MARRSRVSLFLAYMAVALLFSSSAAEAKPGYVVVSPGYRSVEMNLKGSNGFAIQVGVSNRRYTELFASDGSSVVVYLIPRTRTNGDGIKARFPGVGRVSVEFRPAGSEQREPGFFPSCHGGESVRQPGYFVGTIQLRGERGYTAVQATRARGEIVTATREICKRSIFDDSGEKVKEDATELYAYSKSGGRTVGFYGSTVRVPALSIISTSFSGYIAERREGMTIVRHTIARGRERQLIPSDDQPYPFSAAVTPPSPFQGSAVFQRMPGGENSWTGSLSVDFPGRGEVPLAGPSFTARLCQHSGCRRGARQAFATTISQPFIANERESASSEGG